MTAVNSILAQASLLDEIASKVLFQVGPVVFTNHMLMISLATLLLIIVMPLTLRKKVMVRVGFGNAVEAICLYIREEVAMPFLGERTDKYIGYIWSLFFFILTLNLIGMVPIGKAIYLVTGNEFHLHLEGAATANVWVTGALAFMAFLSFHISGIVEQGFVGYVRNFAPKVPWPIMPFMFFMETISSFVRMFSLAIRLFANIMAGHVLLIVLLSFTVIFKNYFVATASTLAVVVMSMMEIFVAFLQAYIFTFLTTIFIGMSIRPEH